MAGICFLPSVLPIAKAPCHTAGCLSLLTIICDGTACKFCGAFAAGFVDVIGQLISAPESYKDVKGAVQNDYQKYLEERWVKALRKKYKVKVDKKVLGTVNNHK